MNCKLKQFKTNLLKLSNIFEMIMSVVLIFVIIISAYRMFFTDFSLFSGNAIEQMDLYVGYIMSIAIGVELVKMLSMHSPSSVVEVLIFAIARQIVAGHEAILDTLIGVAAIVLLFAARKYLFFEKDLSHEDEEKCTM